MLTKDFRQTYDPLPENTKSVLLALSVLIDRVGSLPEEDRSDLFELFQGWTRANDPEDRQNIRQAMEEILAQAPIHSIRMPMPDESPTSSSALKKWAEHVGQAIQNLRKSAGLTQVELAKLADLPQSHISRLENAEHSPTYHTLEKIAKALGVAVRDLDPCAD